VRKGSGLAKAPYHFLIARVEGRTSNHFRNDHSRAKALGDLAERPVRDTSHWGKESIIAHRMAADAQLTGTSRHKLPQK
jgi:hypothetical protein